MSIKSSQFHNILRPFMHNSSRYSCFSILSINSGSFKRKKRPLKVPKIHLSERSGATPLTVTRIEFKTAVEILHQADIIWPSITLNFTYLQGKYTLYTLLLWNLASFMTTHDMCVKSAYFMLFSLHTDFSSRSYNQLLWMNFLEIFYANQQPPVRS